MIPALGVDPLEQPGAEASLVRDRARLAWTGLGTWTAAVVGGLCLGVEALAVRWPAARAGGHALVAGLAALVLRAELRWTAAAPEDEPGDHPVLLLAWSALTSAALIVSGALAVPGDPATGLLASALVLAVAASPFLLRAGEAGAVVLLPVQLGAVALNAPLLRWSPGVVPALAAALLVAALGFALARRCRLREIDRELARRATGPR